MFTVRADAAPLATMPPDLYPLSSGTLEWTSYEDAEYEPVCYRDFRGDVWAFSDVVAATPSGPTPITGASVIDYPSPGVAANMVGHDELIVHPITRELLAVRVNGRCYAPNMIEWR